MALGKGRSKRRKPASARRRTSSASRRCEYPAPGNADQCNNMVALDKWESQGHRCHRHVGKAMVSTAGTSSNPFVDASVVFPDLLENQYAEVVRVRDRSPSAVRSSVAIRTIAETHSNNHSLGISNAKAIVETYNKWSNGQDLSIPELARRRYKDGARLYYQLLSQSHRLRHVAGIHLVRVVDMTIRPRNEPAKTKTDKHSEERKIDLFREQRFPERSHEVVCLEVKRGDVDDRSTMFIVDPLMPALAPVSNTKRSVKDNPQLKSTPFTETPWVANVEDYMLLDRNGSIQWGRSERIESRKGNQR